MAQFDLHRSRDGAGFLLDIQHDLHDRLATRVVAPLLPADAAPTPSRGLNPRIDVEGVPHILFPQYLSAVSRRELGPVAGSLAAQRDAITHALDLLLTGV